MRTDKMLRTVTLHNRTQWMQALGEQEILSWQIVKTLGMAPGRVDLIDFRRPTLPMLARGTTSSDADYAELIKRHLFDEADFMPYRRRILAERRQACIGK